MHPTITYEMVKARLADYQRQNGQAAIAHADRRARRASARPGAHPAAALARRVLALVAARGRVMQGQPMPACQTAPCADCA